MKSAVSLFPCLAAILLTVSACGDKQPGEDAVVVVNGHEITETELNHELSKRGIPASADPALRRAAVEAIVNRRLLVDMAIDRELDRTPEYILEEERMREMLLAESAMQWLAPNSGEADAEAIETLLESNLAGGQRTIFAVNTLQFQRPEDAALMQELSDASSLAEIQAHLTEADINPASARLTWDSATMPPELFGQVSGLPNGELFLIPMNEGMLAGVIADRRQLSLSPDEARALASSAVAEREVRGRLESWLQDARRSAEISYGEDYGPESVQDEEQPEEESAATTADAEA